MTQNNIVIDPDSVPPKVLVTKGSGYESLDTTVVITSDSGPEGTNFYDVFSLYMSRAVESADTKPNSTPLFLKEHPTDDSKFLQDRLSPKELRSVAAFVALKLGFLGSIGSDKLNNMSIYHGDDSQGMPVQTGFNRCGANYDVQSLIDYVLVFFHVPYNNANLPGLT